jgi:hypothetical protein
MGEIFGPLSLLELTEQSHLLYIQSRFIIIVYLFPYISFNGKYISIMQ